MFYSLQFDLSLWIFHVSVRKMCIPLFLDGVFYKCQLVQIDWWCYLGKMYIYRFSAGLISHLLIGGLVVSNSKSGFLVSPFNSVTFALYISVLFWLGAFTYRIVVFLENCPLYRYGMPSLSLTLFLALKSALYEISTAIWAFNKC